MLRLRELMAHGGIAILAVVFALALAAFDLATAFAQQVISVIQQQTVDDEGGGTLTFTVFDTSIYYGDALAYALAAGLLLAALYATWRLIRGTNRTCPECRSYVPTQATACRFCTVELPPEHANA